ncbi:36268_t:CDS:2, partial [Gigaspora margarita]
MLDLITCYDSLNNLKKVSLETLTNNCEDFLRQELIKLLNFIIRREAFDEFRKVSLEIICKDPDLLFNSDEFPKTLYELIQLVRFHQINGAEFMLEVWPYRYLLSESLVEDLFLCYLVPGRVTDKAYAVYCNNGYGPTFGYGYDLVASNDNSNWKNSEEVKVLHLEIDKVLLAVNKSDICGRKRPKTKSGQRKEVKPYLISENGAFGSVSGKVK